MTKRIRNKPRRKGAGTTGDEPEHIAVGLKDWLDDKLKKSLKRFKPKGRPH
jgi:hypothetical protein